MITIPLILIIVLYLVLRKGYLKNIANPFVKEKKLMTIDDKYNSKKVAEQKELNKLLDKINKKGYDNLSNEEKKRLDILSKH